MQRRSHQNRLRNWLLSCLLLAGTLAPMGSGQGSVLGWGRDKYGQASSTPPGADFVYVASGGWHSVAMRPDGSLVGWGRDEGGEVLGLPSDAGFLHVACGGLLTMAIQADGSITGWGADAFGLITSAPSGLSFRQLSIAYKFAVGLRSDGSIVSWGDDYYGQVSNAPGGVGFTQVSALWDHGLALRSDGAVVSWGNDLGGQVSSTPPGSGFTQVAAGWGYSVALRLDGSIAGWGSVPSNLPVEPGFVQLSVGTYHGMGLRADGTLVTWGSNTANLISNTPTGAGYIQVSAGGGHAVVLRSNLQGSPFCFGDSTGMACPCAGDGQAGEGCVNTTGLHGATLIGLGEAFLSNDSFRFLVVGVPAEKPGLILRGDSQVNGGLGVMAGDGLLCVTGQAARSQVQMSSSGSPSFLSFTDFQGAPFGQSSFGAGVPSNYQFWYRDAANPCTGSGFNLSNAWSTTWLP